MPIPIPTTVPVIGETESITAEAVITANQAEVLVDETELNALLETDTDAETVTIDVSQIEADVNTVVIPVSTVQAVAERAASDDKTLAGMDIVMPQSMVTFDAAALTSIAEQAEEDTVTLHVEEVEAEALTPTQQTALSEVPESAIVVDITLRSGDSVISDFRGGSAVVRLPYTPQPGEDTDTITVWFVGQDGTLEEIPCRYENGYVVFTVQHFSNYIVKPGLIAASVEATPGPAASPASPQNDDGSHCFICGWFGHDISPWCWLVPLVISVVLVAALWLYLRKRRK